MRNFPNQPIRIITGVAGSDLDLVVRLIAHGISRSLGQPVKVENREPDLLAEIVFKAPPDGHTLLVSTQNLWVAPVIRNTPYDAVKDFSPVTVVAASPLVFCVHPSVAANSIEELIALAKARPGKLNYCSGLDGSTSHLGGALFTKMAGVNIVRIPYKHGMAGIKDLIAGKVQLMIPGACMGMEQVKLGKLRALAVTSAQPSATAPGLPTVAASGLPGYEIIQTLGMFAPAKTPAAVIRRLNHEVVQALNEPDVKEKLLNIGVDVVVSSPEEFAVRIKSERTKWGKLIKDIGIKTANS